MDKMMKWRLWISAIVLLVVLAVAFHTLVWQRHQIPVSGVRVTTETGAEGQDWLISLYDQGQQRWQANEEGYRLVIERLGQDAFDLDISYQNGESQRRIRQRVRLNPGLTLVAAFGPDQHSHTPHRVLIDRQISDSP
ncbi:MAG: hypothetical protein CL537_08335 [Alcanivoracaceae bacterium]|jgi:hypothetical protein|uniref:Uncharacterized protein n=1 Tax=Alcanivorax profundi TaxID=2338368 RepID=A0A418XX17_9GAMM|nr:MULTISPECIES: hypothetical protein [Alcanivorax]MAX55501.1 hypothetical protein [Alcanivoracaceae bacterium]MCG8437623.1 hypothetical protein [Pseudomonadales bacterium]MEE2869152.1 hypothetical protein [Pseudomonadota bacterium]PNE03357.1 hypothetical protein A15D_01065 [Alcanivorax sp. MD8A]RJG17360.1 hypothetical protein D4A39_11595 [Alcanivorax profundi]|tara:strand:- start:272 stop:682 length:411 start_codon:yes stop_codon:yes gene_type:complete